jgi:hypothetical protein
MIIGRHLSNLRRGKTEHRFHMLIDEPTARWQILQSGETLEEAGIGVQEVPILQTVIVNATGREGVAYKQDGFTAVFSDQESWW